MAGNPLVDQGTLNRLRGSVVVPAFASLNVTAAFLGSEGIGLSLDGATTAYIPTLTGAVTSPAPYQQASVTLHLLKTQFLAGLYKGQLESDARIGEITVRSDSSAFPNYDFFNCSIMSVADMKFDGSDAGYRVTLGGIYYINQALWLSA